MRHLIIHHLTPQANRRRLGKVSQLPRPEATVGQSYHAVWGRTLQLSKTKKISFRCNIRVGVRFTKHRVRVSHLSTISYIQVQKHLASGGSYGQSTPRQLQFIRRVSIASSNRKVCFARLRPVAPQTSHRILRDALGCHHHISLYHVVS